jgi:predicted RNase H-like nuclease (RuvC/YqgF family)
LTADQIVDLFERDLRARKRLAELIVMEPDIRLAIINAVLREVATKDDIKALENDIKALGDATRKDIKELEGRIQELSNMVSELRGAYKELSKRIDDLDKRIDSLDKRIDFATKVTLLLTGSVLAALIAEIISRILLPR